MAHAEMLEYLLRLGDDRLILGHRLSEWCGHGPILEEDIALANIALSWLGIPALEHLVHEATIVGLVVARVDGLVVFQTWI